MKKILMFLVILGPLFPSQAQALHKAISDGNTERLANLLQQDCDKEIKDGFGRTPLGHAVAKNNLQQVEILLGFGANTEVLCLNQSSPLMTASFNGNKDIVLALLRAGAKKEFANKEGATALSEANRGGHKAIAKILKQSQ